MTEAQSQAPEKAVTDTPVASQTVAVASAATAAPAPSFVASDPPAGKHYFWGTGRRKRSVARVRIRPGSGKFVVNGREVDEFFCVLKDRQTVRRPMATLNMLTSWDVAVNVNGGGLTGQAGAICLGLARALAQSGEDIDHALRRVDLLTRDPRMTERKKPGQAGARKRFQFSKR
jgi:small subunit ribosomal protein S9